MNPVQALRSSVKRWRQMHALRVYFARQRLIPRPCPLCGSPTPELLVRGDRDFIGISTSQCPRCGFIFSAPYYTPAVIAEFYQERYRSQYKNQPDPRGLSDLQGYLRERAEFYGLWLARRQLLPGAGGGMLDVGCGDGTLLLSLRDRRPDLRLAGVEPTVSFARHLGDERGLEIASALDGLAIGQRFELVTLVHVLEHVQDPVGLLQEVRGRLEESGRVYVDVPDVGSHSSLMDLHLAHCNHFSVHTLGLALSLAGYRVIEAAAHRPPTLPPSLFAIAEVDDSAPGATVLPDPDAVTLANRVRAIEVSRFGHWRRRAAARLGRPE